MAASLVAALGAAALILSGCAGVRPVLTVDAQGFDAGVHGDWREMAEGVRAIFARRQREAGLPDFSLPHADAPSASALPTVRKAIAIHPTK